MNNLSVVVATGLFTLGGVLLGGLLTPLTQLYLERNREQRAADRAKVLVAGELLHAQLMLRTAADMKHWLPVEDINGLLPTSAWRENRSSFAGKVDKDLWDQLIVGYARLEVERARFVQASRLPPLTPLPAEEAQGLRLFSYQLAQLGRKLDGFGLAWLDEIQHQFKPRLANLNDNFRQHLDGLSDADLKKEIAEVKARAKELGEVNRDLGDGGAWSAEINGEIERRLK